MLISERSDRTGDRKATEPEKPLSKSWTGLGGYQVGDGNAPVTAGSSKRIGTGDRRGREATEPGDSFLKVEPARVAIKSVTEMLG